MADEPTFKEEIKADPSVCERCEKRECTCWAPTDNGSVIAAPTGKAWLVGMKRFYREMWDG
jgi:hypothetical protein